MNKREILIFVALATLGVAVWKVVTLTTGEREAWDSLLYFTIGLPAMLVVTAVAGYAAPHHSWLFGIAVVCLQPVALLADGELGPLALVGLFTFGFLAGLCALSAYIGAALRLQRDKRKETNRH